MVKKRKRLREYSVPLVWSVWGRMSVQTGSKEEAVCIALDSETPLPDDGDYITDSISVDDGSVIEVCSINKKYTRRKTEHGYRRKRRL